MVARDDVLDDGQPQPRPLLAATRFRIDPIKALGKARDVLFLDPGTEIGDRNGMERSRSAFTLLQRNFDPPATSTVFNGVVGKVFDDFEQLLPVADDD